MEPFLFESGSLILACTSDTHNDIGTDYVPAADIFLHAGDLTEYGSYKELETAYNWIAALPHSVKVIISGNHDLGLDPAHSSYSKEAYSLYTSEAARKAGIHYLDREVREVARFRAYDGSTKPLRVYGNPCQPDYKKSKYCFTYLPYPDRSAAEAWQTAPLDPGQSDVNIWLMHSPPKNRLDDKSTPPRMGCELEAKYIAKARPLVAVFGHFHATPGVEKVTWSRTEDQVESSELLSDISNVQDFDLSAPSILEKDCNTLFVNATWMTVQKGKVEKRNSPWLIRVNFDT